MDRPTHPWLVFLRAKFGDHPEWTTVAEWLLLESGYVVQPESLRLIAQGHRRPSGDLALAIESACAKQRRLPHVTARDLLSWPHYSRAAHRKVA